MFIFNALFFKKLHKFNWVALCNMNAFSLKKISFSPQKIALFQKYSTQECFLMDFSQYVKMSETNNLKRSWQPKNPRVGFQFKFVWVICQYQFLQRLLSVLKQPARYAQHTHRRWMKIIVIFYPFLCFCCWTVLFMFFQLTYKYLYGYWQNMYNAVQQQKQRRLENYNNFHSPSIFVQSISCRLF